jgi:hypothetical protein
MDPRASAARTSRYDPLTGLPAKLGAQQRGEPWI